MLLKALHDLAHTPGLGILDDMAFERRAVRWIVNLDADGRLQGTGPVDTSADGRRGHEFAMVPRTARVKKGKVAEFLADGIDAVFGLSPNPSKPKDAKMLREKCLDFWDQIAMAAIASPHPALSALLRYRPEPGVPPSFLRAENKKWIVRTAEGRETKIGSDQFTFRVDGLLLIDHEVPIRPWWRRVFAEQIRLQEKESKRSICLITGEPAQPIARTHNPRIVKIPGVGIDGAIVSFEKSAPAFSSYGQEQSHNAPCSIRATWAYSLALQYLLDHGDHHIRLGDAKKGTVLCFWVRTEPRHSAFFAELLNSPQPDAVCKFLKSPWSGIPRELAQRDQFFAVTLTGNAGRIVVAHWMNCQLDKAVESLARWFEDLRVETLRDSIGAELHPALAIRQLARCTVPLKKKGMALFPDDEKLLAGVSCSLYRAALEESAPPLSLLKPVLDQFHARLTRDEHYNLFRDESRFSLLKLILNRNREESDMEIQPRLAETNDPAYNSGRLLAVFDDLQRRSTEWKLTGASVAERYYASASSAPATGFGILWRLHFHHLKKLRSLQGRHAAAATAIERRIGEIAALFGQTPEMVSRRMPPRFPRTLDLQGQSRFALGFYQQKAHECADRKNHEASMPVDQGTTEANP